MKKPILFTIAAIAFLAACKKESTQQGGSKASKHQYSPNTSLMKSVSVQGFEPNTMSWADLTVGTDPQDVLYRKAQLYFSIGLTEVVKDSTIADWITRQTLANEFNVIHFDELFAQFPATKQIIESVNDPLGAFNNYTFEQVQQLMQYDTFNIKASIYLTNAQIADPTYKPICAGGFDLDLEDTSAAHPSDAVLAWHLNDNNEITKITIWEDNAKTSLAPVFSIDGRSTVNIGNLLKTTDEDPGLTSGFPPITDHPNMRVSIISYRINVRHDISPNSELHMQSSCSYTHIPGKRPFMKTGCAETFWDLPQYDKRLDVIHKSKMGHLFTNKDIYYARAHDGGMGYGEYDYNSLYPSRKWLFYNTYEYDWFASHKPLTPSSIKYSSMPFPINIGLTGKMSKYDEWYENEPWFPKYFTLPYPFVGWSMGFNMFSGKGGHEIKIVNHCTY